MLGQLWDSKAVSTPSVNGHVLMPIVLANCNGMYSRCVVRQLGSIVCWPVVHCEQVFLCRGGQRCDPKFRQCGQFAGGTWIEIKKIVCQGPTKFERAFETWTAQKIFCFRFWSASIVKTFFATHFSLHSPVLPTNQYDNNTRPPLTHHHQNYVLRHVRFR
jgi:hypothetical protein